MSQVMSQYPDPPDASGSRISLHRGKILIGLIVLISSMGYLAFVALQSATVYYYTVGELNAQEPISEGKIVRVSGKLVNGSFFREDGSTMASFDLTDGSQTLHATHNGVVPDLFFNDHSEIILEGNHTPNGTFESHNVIVKCPSKYVAAN